MPRVLIPTLGMALALHASALASAEPQREVLSEQGIRRIFIGKIATDGVHFAYHLKPDGTITGSEMGRGRKGTWVVRRNQLCFSTPTGAPENCWTVVRLDGNLVFRRDGVDVLDITVEKPGSKYQFE
jgi:hypothetical protein